MLVDDSFIQSAFSKLSELAGLDVTEFPEDVKTGRISASFKLFLPHISSVVGVFPE